ncbi:MAG: hypothetical protein MUE44_34715 [Oscillatoriaceae cyanobacterium Prado104]|jgi:hypothetical protein|nr:hypothetical protein [Oscillatoriaceae cyanobacterium Prado104]
MLKETELKYDRLFEEKVGFIVDLNAIADRLQGTGCCGCEPFEAEQVKLAFIKWLENHLESIEQNPEWFVRQNPKHFEKYLPELDSSFFPEEEYDWPAIYDGMQEGMSQKPVQEPANA